jgi:hypothetical protein
MTAMDHRRLETSLDKSALTKNPSTPHTVTINAVDTSKELAPYSNIDRDSEVSHEQTMLEGAIRRAALVPTLARGLRKR